MLFKFKLFKTFDVFTKVYDRKQKLPHPLDKNKKTLLHFNSLHIAIIFSSHKFLRYINF